MILQILYILCCIYVIRELLKWTSKNSDTLRPPDLPGGWPIIGHAWKMVGDRKNPLKMIKFMSKETLDNGGVLTARLGPQKIYLLSEPDDCIKVSNECLEKDYFYNFAKPFLGSGLTTAQLPVWKPHRKLMSPAFKQRILNDYLVVFNRQAKRLVEQLKPTLGKGPFNPEKYIKQNNLESICMTAFGADVAELGGLHTQYLKGIEDILQIVTERFQKFWLHSDFIYNWSALKKRQDICVNNIQMFANAILSRRKSDLKEIYGSLDKSGQFTPMMSHLLKITEENDCYSEEDILYESSTMVAAGYDTSACTITLALVLLGSHPEAQEKAYQELQKLFEKDTDVTNDDLYQLVYLEAVVKETMRLYPFAPIIARYIVNDVKLNGYTLKAGNGIGILIWAIHRHPMWGPDAELFKPERWLDGSLPSNAFGGFSFGKRSCIGKTYAMMTIKTTLSHILRNYQINSDMSKLELEIHGGTLKPIFGHQISIEERISVSSI